MAEKEIFCAYGIDIDAVAGWLGSYGGEGSPDDISRGMFAGEVGTPRLLDLFERYGLRTTWFIPGHSIETFPGEMGEVVRRDRLAPLLQRAHGRKNLAVALAIEHLGAHRVAQRGQGVVVQQNAAQNADFSVVAVRRNARREFQRKPLFLKNMRAQAAGARRPGVEARGAGRA